MRPCVAIRCEIWTCSICRQCGSVSAAEWFRVSGSAVCPSGNAPSDRLWARVASETLRLLVNNYQNTVAEKKPIHPTRKVNKNIYTPEYVNKNKGIFEPRPELTYNDISDFYKRPDTNVVNKRASIRYKGAKTDGQINYTEANPPFTEQKLFRRESIIASWQHLKAEKERALGGKQNQQDEPKQMTVSTRPKRTRKVTRSHSAKENTNLTRRKSVIYSYDKEKKILKEEYNFISDNSDEESLSQKTDDRTCSNISLDHIDRKSFPCQKSSSFDKIKCMLLRVFGSTKTQ